MRIMAPLPLTASLLDEIGMLLESDPGGETHAWLDRKNATILTSTSMYGLGDDDDEDDDDEPEDTEEDDPAEVGESALPDDGEERPLPGWQRTERERVRGIVADHAGRYVRIPVGAEYGNPGMLREFACTVTDPALRDAVEGTMRGRGAFRRVKDLLQRRGALDLWHAFSDEKRMATAQKWLEERGIEWVEDPPCS